MSVKPAADTIQDILEEFAEDWGLDDLEITPDTKLREEIGFESTDLMQLFSAVAEDYPTVTFTFQDLVMKDGKFVTDLTVGEIVAFVQENLRASAAKLKQETA